MRKSERWHGILTGRGAWITLVGTKSKRRLRAGWETFKAERGRKLDVGDDHTVCGLVAEVFETKGEGVALI